jgi:hypothetical protein
MWVACMIGTSDRHGWRKCNKIAGAIIAYVHVGRHPMPTSAVLRSTFVGKGFPTYKDVGSADYAGAIIGRPTWLDNYFFPRP